jgi:hypothetical protein
VRRVFLLSPAHCGGQRARAVLSERARFDLAARLRSTTGVELGELFTFLSGLYFRGKLAYATAFASSPADVLVITPGAGLLSPAAHVTLEAVRAFARVGIDAANAAYRVPLERSVRTLVRRIDPHDEVVLLGSIASAKYTDVLDALVGARLRFPAAFVGRGDMSRGGLLLRAVAAGEELAYLPVAGAVRRGPRPPRLVPLPRRAASAS